MPIGVVKHADEVEGAAAGIARGAKEAEEAAIAVKAERRTSTLKRAGDGPGYAATRTASAERIFADMDKWSLAPLSDRQKQMILDKLGAVKQRSSALGEAVRKGGFSKADERKVIAEWERQTGMKWPAGATPHHAIPIKNGGAVDQWWNIIPVKNPHTGTIHGTGSALRTELPYLALSLASSSWRQGE